MDLSLLRTLCETPGVPGHEARVRAILRAEAEPLCDEITLNPLGTLICRRRGEGEDPARLLLLAHMDEIGFLVNHVTDKGFLHVQPVGGFDPRTLFARRVLVSTAEGDLRGVLNAPGVPIHISTEADRKKIPQAHEFVVDLGIGSRAGEIVRVGDMVTLDAPFLDLGETVVAKALDNRVACWLGIETLRALHRSGHAAEVTVAFTVQEEVGLRGARTAAYAVRPHLAIGIDTTLACDTPGVPEADRTSVLGGGFGLHLRDRDFIADMDLAAEIEALARARGIPCQRTILRSGGQDGAAAQQAAAGARAAAIVVPCRYVHTVTEMIAKSDLAAARDILAAFAETLPARP